MGQSLPVDYVTSATVSDTSGALIGRQMYIGGTGIECDMTMSKKVCKVYGCNLSVFKANQCFYHYWGKYKDWKKRQQNANRKKQGKDS